MSSFSGILGAKNQYGRWVPEQALGEGLSQVLLMYSKNWFQTWLTWQELNVKAIAGQAPQRSGNPWVLNWCFFPLFQVRVSSCFIRENLSGCIHFDLGTLSSYLQKLNMKLFCHIHELFFLRFSKSRIENYFAWYSRTHLSRFGSSLPHLQKLFCHLQIMPECLLPIPVRSVWNPQAQVALQWTSHRRSSNTRSTPSTQRPWELHAPLEL